MIDQLKDTLKCVQDLRREVKATSSNRISKKATKSGAEKAAEDWFGGVLPKLKTRNLVEADALQKYSDAFTQLLKLTSNNNLKTSYLAHLDIIAKNFRDDIIIPYQLSPTAGSQYADELRTMMNELNNSELGEYIEEAARCVEIHAYRAAAVLGWCAAVDVSHSTIEAESFAKFNVTSSQMASDQKGRFKRFSSPQNVKSVSDVRTVFDTVVLWILEGMGLIDSNQHTRLRSCFDLRNQCGHPGEAPVTSTT